MTGTRESTYSRSKASGRGIRLSGPPRLFYLQFEEWEMDQIEAQEEVDDVDIVSEDEGYDSDGEDEGDIDHWDFGIAPVLWHIQL